MDLDGWSGQGKGLGEFSEGVGVLCLLKGIWYHAPKGTVAIM